MFCVYRLHIPFTSELVAFIMLAFESRGWAKQGLLMTLKSIESIANTSDTDDSWIKYILRLSTCPRFVNFERRKIVII